MTRQTRTLILLAAAAAACAGLYAGLRVWNSGREAADGSIHITQMDSISALSFVNAQGELSFTQTDGVWQWDGDPAFPADQTQLDNLARQAGKLTALRAIDSPEGLASYGLDAPALTISVTGGGQTAELLLGTAAEDYCYVKRGDSDAIYTVDPDLAGAFQDLELLDLAEIPEFPAVGAGNLASIVWSSGETALTLTKTETAGEGEETETAWDVNGAAIPDGNSTLSSLIAQIASLDFSACYDYQGREDTLAACGLDSPSGTLSVVYGEENDSFTLVLGALYSAGTSYYAQLEGDPAVYLLPASSAGTITGLTAEALTAA